MNYPLLTDYIVNFPSAVSPEFLQDLLQRAESEDDWHPGMIRAGDVESQYRDCGMQHLSKWRDLDDQLFEVMSHCSKEYAKKHPEMTVTRDEGYTLLRYTEGQHHRQHVDMMSNFCRVLSCSVIVNDDYEGDGLLFFDGTYKPEAKAGDVLMWPSNFVYPHQISPVKKGVRYAIITWFYG